MTPKQEAAHLTLKYYDLFTVSLENTISLYEARECAKVDVTNTINALTDYGYSSFELQNMDRTLNHYYEVLHELEKQ
jgi:hypothetical protein